MTGFIRYLDESCNYNPNPFLVTAREVNWNRDSGRSARKEPGSARLVPKSAVHSPANRNSPLNDPHFDIHELAELSRNVRPYLKHDKGPEEPLGYPTTLANAGLKSESAVPARSLVPVGSRRRRDVFERLTDHRFFTGIHRERFDEEGRGRGLAGRENLFLFDGNTESYSRAHEVYSSVLPRQRPPVVPPGSLGARKFGLQIATPKLMWLYRNGDKHHDGLAFYLRPFIKSMDTLMIEIGKQLPLIAGPVRRLYDQNLQRVTDLGEIVDGAKYLCTSGEGPAPADKLDKFLSEWVIQKMF